MLHETNILSGPEDNYKFPKDIPLGQLMLDQLKEHASRIAQVDSNSGKQQTFQQILNDSRRLALYLSREGLQVDDSISICSKNDLTFVIPICAALYLGVAIAPLNPLYSEREYQHALNISKPKYIFISPLVAKRMQEVVKKLVWSPKLILLHDLPDINLPSLNDLISKILITDVNKLKIPNICTATHVVAILCSSGTTGFPKGVMLTDRNFTTVIRCSANPLYGNLTKDIVSLGLLPFFHAYSFVQTISMLIIGIKIIVQSRFEEGKFLEVIQKYKIDHLTLVPPLMVFLAKHPLVDRYNLSSIKSIWCGAAPLSEKVQMTVMKRLNISDIRQGYGLTETTLAVLLSPKNSNKPGSVGVLCPGVLCKVIPVSEEGSKKNLGPNCKGELCFKGNMIMKSYCGDTVSTAATIDKDGWLHTGDIGYYDENGYFYIVDRLKELIKYKGFQVPPAELEGILLTHSEIKDAAVIGLTDEEVGELPLAFVVKQTGSNVSAEDIVKYVSERVSNQKRLRGGVRFVTNIPKTPSGKILRRQLRNIINSKL